MVRRNKHRLWPIAAAALIAAAIGISAWPGTAEYDAVDQYRQVLTGQFEDWHPPIMARLWALLHGIADGQGPMLVLQLALFWSGLGLLASALAARGRQVAAGTVLAVGLWPVFLGWEVDVLKDTQMAAALVALCGLVGYFHLTERPVPGWALALGLILLVYATLLRANAAFATVPFGLALAGWCGVQRTWARGALAMALILAVFASFPFINQRLLGAESSGAGRSLLIFDLGGVARRSGTAPVIPQALWREAAERHCLTSFYWDPLGDEKKCGFVSEAFDMAAPGPALPAAWARAILLHPLSYASHRLAHWNSTLRWWTPRAWPVSGPGGTERNNLGLRDSDPAGREINRAAHFLTPMPFGWPFLWLLAGAGALVATRGTALPTSRLAASLAWSGVALEVSFVLVSIASDLRYHLWPMISVALAWTLLLGEGRSRRLVSAVLAVLALAAVPAVVARALLPPASMDDPASLDL